MTTVPEKVSNDSLKLIGEALVSVCEDSDPKVRETPCSIVISSFHFCQILIDSQVRDASAAALALWASVVKSRGKAANDALKVSMYPCYDIRFGVYSLSSLCIIQQGLHCNGKHIPKSIQEDSAAYKWRLW